MPGVLARHADWWAQVGGAGQELMAGGR
jgi:hypothetical protein